MRVFSNIVFMGVAVKKKTPFWLPLSVSLYFFLSLFVNCENITDLANGVILGEGWKGW